MAYGYRYGEVETPLLAEIKECVITETNAPRDTSSRPAVQVSLGCDVKYVAPPKPDLSDASTAEAGVRKRFLLKPPSPDKEMLAELKSFVCEWLKKNLPQLPPDADTSAETWLEGCNYPRYRKEELLKLWTDRNGVVSKRDYLVKSFIKDETYPEYKHARAINSRTDMFKVAVGPIFRLIEKEVFKLPYFIKKIPVAQRPEYITNLLSRIGAKYFEGDFTAYESHFVREIMEAVEFPLYDHMVEHLAGGKEWMRLVRRSIGGKNHCVFKWFTVDVQATRMSGEMNTSLGNGFTNLMLLLFLFHKLGEEVTPIVEGDDSLTSYMTKCPTAADFKRLGFTIKCASRDELSEASFCGIIFDPQDMVNVTDPSDVLANFGWAARAYTRARTGRLRELLRSKSLSYAHQYPGCPIISSLAHYGLRVTRSVDLRHFVENDHALSLWEREQLRDALAAGKLQPTPVPFATRLLVERLYGISVKLQCEIEHYLDNLDSLQQLAGPVSLLTFHKDFYDYNERYTATVYNMRNLDTPDPTWSYRKGFVSEF